LSLPMPTDGLPMGLMLLGRHGADAWLLAAARAVEQRLY
jgi:Asp-tRNA(Asn)/Glu-tRNA(Gln) amidotransferase A subunit family amidase